MKNKKALWLLEETSQILIAVIVSILIFFFALIIYQFLIPNNESKKATNELETFEIYFADLSESNLGPVEYVTLQTPKWYLFSAEYSGRLCDGKFCLCLCEDTDCKQTKEKGEYRACKPTLLYVSLRDKSSEGTLTYHGKMETSQPPEAMNIYFVKETVYPFRALPQEYANEVSPGIPVYFKYEEKWLWGVDLKNWYEISKFSEQEASFRENLFGEVSQRTFDFIKNSLSPTVVGAKNPEEVEKYLESFGISKSEGVYVIERST